MGRYLRRCYLSIGPLADQMAHGAISSTEAVKGAIADVSNLGLDELVFLPSVSDMGQREPLADIV